MDLYKNTYIPYGKQSISASDIASVVSVLKSPFYFPEAKNKRGMILTNNKKSMKNYRGYAIAGGNYE